MKSHYDNLYLGIGTVVLFCLVSLWIIPEYIILPSSAQMTGVSPSFWPEVISWSLVALGLMLAFSSYMQIRRAKRRAGEAGQEAAKVSKVPQINPRAVARGVVTIGALAGYYVLVEYLGMLLSSMLAVIFYALIYGEHRFKLTVPLAVLVPLFLYFFFVKVADIPLPSGILGI